MKKALFDSFWRAAVYCLHPKVMGMSLLPLLLMGVAAGGFWYFFWDGAVAQVRTFMAEWLVVSTLVSWLEGWGLAGLSAWLAPMAILLLMVPLLMVGSLVVVAAMMTPAMVTLVSQRRFASLERLQGGSVWGSVWGGLWATVLALILLLLSIPLWFIPPLMLLLPPLIWGWLTYRVMTYDVLSEHACSAELATLMREHRVPLLAIGVVTGYLGAAPSVVWASGVLFVALAPVLIPLAIWIYTLVFAFSSLWFTHYALTALEQMRAAHRPPARTSFGTKVFELKNASEIKMLP